jgi:Tol biopolymer transport system component
MRRGLIAMAVAGLALAGATPSWAVFPGQNGRIMYAAGEGSDYAVHTILPSGHGDQLIGIPQPGVWSPNGHRIAFTGAEEDIYTTWADGTDLRRLTFNNQSLVAHYAPGGRRIAFVGPKGITTMRNDGSAKRVISDQSGLRTWTPNNQVAFIAGGTDTRPSLWAMNPNGTNPHRLVLLGVNGGLGPFYSPDGHSFLFVRLGGASNRHVLMADADGSDVREPPCPGFFAQHDPVTYSPDGRWVLAAAPNSGDPRNITSYRLIRIRLSTCQGQRVVSPVAPDFPPYFPDWQALP